MRTVESSTSRSIARSTAGGATVEAGAEAGGTTLAAAFVPAAGAVARFRAAAGAAGLAAVGAAARVSRAAADARACFRSGLAGYSRTSHV